MSISIVKYFQLYFFPSPKMSQKIVVLGEIRSGNIEDKC